MPELGEDDWSEDRLDERDVEKERREQDDPAQPSERLFPSTQAREPVSRGLDGHVCKNHGPDNCTWRSGLLNRCISVRDARPFAHCSPPTREARQARRDGLALWSLQEIRPHGYKVQVGQ